MEPQDARHAPLTHAWPAGQHPEAQRVSSGRHVVMHWADTVLQTWPTDRQQTVALQQYSTSVRQVPPPQVFGTMIVFGTQT